MKRMLLLGLLFVFGALAVQAVPAPWAEGEEATAAREGRRPQHYRVSNREEAWADKIRREARENFRIRNPEKVSVLPLLLAGKTLKVSVYPPSSTNTEKHRWAQNLVRNAYNDWFKNAADTIKNRARSKEFADVLPVLKRGVAIAFVDFVSTPGDVWVAVEETLEDVREECECDTCVGCESPGSEKYPMNIVVAEKGKYSDLLHEIGHTFGFEEAYDLTEEDFQKNTYRSAQLVTDTVMHTKDTSLTPDDADGLINMIDSWTIKAMKDKYPQDWCEHISSRVRNGWDSLHRGKNGKSTDRYAMGTTVKNLSKLPPAQRCEASIPLKRPQAKQAGAPSAAQAPRSSSTRSEKQLGKPTPKTPRKGRVFPSADNI